jgi:hypothetical protein
MVLGRRKESWGSRRCIGREQGIDSSVYGDASGCVFVGRFRSISAVSSARGFFALLQNIFPSNKLVVLHTDMNIYLGATCIYVRLC